MGASSTEAAQILANEANLMMTDQNNWTSMGVAHMNNIWNKALQDEQNTFNKNMWDLENEYNSPEAQMERYIAAGINPVWAISKGDAGQAQQLTSAPAQPAQMPNLQAGHVEPVYDPNQAAKVGNLVAASNNVMNDARDFYKLSLEAQDVETRKSKAASDIALQKAEAAFKKSQTASQDLFNNLNTLTFDSQVGSKVHEYNLLKNQVDNGIKDLEVKNSTIANMEATKSQIKAQTEYVQMQTDHYLEQIAQRWKELSIAQQNADTNVRNTDINQQNANTAVAAQKTNEARLSVEVQKYTQDLQSKSNEQILEYIKLKSNPVTGSWLSFKNAFTGWREFVDSKFGVTVVDNTVSQLEAAGMVLSDRFIKDPTEANQKAYEQYRKFIYSLPMPRLPQVMPAPGSSSDSVLNPSGSWLP